MLLRTLLASLVALSVVTTTTHEVKKSTRRSHDALRSSTHLTTLQSTRLISEQPNIHKRKQNHLTKLHLDSHATSVHDPNIVTTLRSASRTNTLRSSTTLRSRKHSITTSRPASSLHSRRKSTTLYSAGTLHSRNLATTLRSEPIQRTRSQTIAPRLKNTLHHSHSEASSLQTRHQTKNSHSNLGTTPKSNYTEIQEHRVKIKNKNKKGRRNKIRNKKKKTKNGKQQNTPPPPPDIQPNDAQPNNKPKSRPSPSRPQSTTTDNAIVYSELVQELNYVGMGKHKLNSKRNKNLISNPNPEEQISKYNLDVDGLFKTTDFLIVTESSTINSQVDETTAAVSSRGTFPTPAPSNWIESTETTSIQTFESSVWDAGTEVNHNKFESTSGVFPTYPSWGDEEDDEDKEEFKPQPTWHQVDWPTEISNSEPSHVTFESHDNAPPTPKASNPFQEEEYDDEEDEDPPSPQNPIPAFELNDTKTMSNNNNERDPYVLYLEKVYELNGGVDIPEALLPSYDDIDKFDRLRKLTAKPQSFKSDILIYKSITSILTEMNIEIPSNLNVPLFLSKLHFAPPPNKDKENDWRVLQYLKLVKEFFPAKANDEGSNKSGLYMMDLLVEIIKMKNNYIKDKLLTYIFKKIEDYQSFNS